MKTLQDGQRFTFKGDNFGRYTLTNLFSNKEVEENLNLSHIRLCAIKDPIMLTAEPREYTIPTVELEDKEQFYFNGTRYVVLSLSDKHDTCDNIRILKV